MTRKRAQYVGVTVVFLVAALALSVTSADSSDIKPGSEQADDTSTPDNSTKASESLSQAVSGASDKTSNTSKVDVRLKTNQHSSDGSSSSHTSLTVNGQDVPVDSGNVNYSHRSSNGNTTVNISAQSSSSSSGSTAGGGM